ncbi:hypothetical protein WJX84_006429 [Apatococcus fuscideae]|uniref:protein-serine/threonine phosphatase n=1 Tax=Apatococcus fuscideae TaxID=2026836 RepID=A0AAW1TEM7_9CHLO
MPDDATDDLEVLLGAELARNEEAAEATIATISSTQQFRPPSKKRGRDVESIKESDTGNKSAGVQRISRPASARDCPPHPGFVQGMCIRCGKPRDDLEPAASANVALRYLHAGLELSKTEADRLRDESLKRVLAGNRLILVLDLDHTLLTSTKNSEIHDEQLHRKLSKMLAEQQRLPELDRSLYWFPHMDIWTKFRPGVRDFLERMHLCYELHIYTHGTRPYALEMSRVLDPQRRLFAERIVSACDSADKNHKNLDILLGVETAVLVVDNTHTVWPQHLANLLHCTSFVYFPADVPRMGGTALLATCDTSHEQPDPMLPAAAAVLEDVHSMYFAGASAAGMDARQCLAAARSKILAGVSLVFSRVFPQVMASPEANSLWKLANQMGAACSLATSAATTHVVAPCYGTDKVMWAQKHGKHVITPAWLTASSRSWQRAAEEDYVPEKPK